MVKRRIEIKEIAVKAKRQVTFTKRRQRLFQMADEFGKKCDAEVAVITISKAGNIYASGHPTVDFILQRYKEAKKAESSSEKRDDDDDQQEVQNQREDFRGSEIEGSPNNDDGYDQNKKSDDTDLAFSTSLPLINDEEKEDESSGMMIKQKEESARGLAINLSAEGMEKNNSHQEEQEKKVPEEVGYSISDSKMMPLLRAVPVENLELHELEQLVAQMEEKRKKLLNQANQIKKRNTDSSGDCK